MRRRALLATLAAGATGLAGCSLSLGESPTDTDREPSDTSGSGLFGTDPPSTATDGPGTRAPGTPRTEPPRTRTEPPRSATDRPRTETEPPGTETEPHPETDTPTGDFSPPEESTSVVELETAPRAYAFNPTTMHTDDGAEIALWFDRTATADHPARLRGYLENANDYANTFEIEWIPAVGRVHARPPRGVDYENRLHLAPVPGNDLAQTVPDLARTDEGYWYANGIDPWMRETYRMEPGERVNLAYVVVGEPGLSGRPTGTYEFRGDDRDARIHVWDTASPGPEDRSRFAGRSVPSFPDQSVRWYHEADRTTPAFVRPSTERLELDGLVEFEAVNHSRETLRCGHWNLHKLVGGQWYHVAPSAHYSVCLALRPGAHETWALRAFNAEAVGCGGDCGDGWTLGYLGGGTYAVVAGYGHATDSSAALVELVGDPAPVVPADDVTVDRDGSTVTVTTARYGDGEESPDATFTLARADSAARRVLAEQIMRTSGVVPVDDGLRNALPFVREGVDRVVVRTDVQGVDRAVGSDSKSRRFRFRGQAYEVTADRPDGGN